MTAPDTAARADVVTRVLLVDDRPDNLLALEAVLEPLGYELVKVGSGFEALSYLLANEVSTIVLDVQMPDMDGFETAELVKSRAATKHVPIIFLTAVSQDSDHQLRGYDVGAVDYISKPFDPTVLRAKVQALVTMSNDLLALGASSAADARSRARELGADPEPLVGLKRLVDLEIAPELTGPGLARKAVHAALAGHDEEILNTAVLLVSELVANSVVHAQSTSIVRLDLGATFLRAEVVDSGDELPDLSPHDFDDDSGRGLEMVRRLADRCGWTLLDGGKFVWFEIDLGRHARP